MFEKETGKYFPTFPGNGYKKWKISFINNNNLADSTNYWKIDLTVRVLSKKRSCKLKKLIFWEKGMVAEILQKSKFLYVLYLCYIKFYFDSMFHIYVIFFTILLYIYYIFIYTLFVFSILLYISIFILFFLNFCGNVFIFIICTKLL